MKKSEILKRVLTMIGTDYYSNFICNILEHQFYADPDHSTKAAQQNNANALALVKWIEKSIKRAPDVANLGVEAWLKYKGYVGHREATNNDMLEYRSLWLQNMIAYWEAQGD